MQNRLVNKVATPQMTIRQKKIHQWQIETKTWKRVLDFSREENIHSKNRLSDILKNGFDRRLLGDLEDFQNEFIKHDEIMGLLRNEIAELDNILYESSADAVNPMVVEKKLDNLRHNLADAENRFGKLQLDFNRYLSEKIM